MNRSDPVLNSPSRPGPTRAGIPVASFPAGEDHQAMSIATGNRSIQPFSANGHGAPGGEAAFIAGSLQAELEARIAGEVRFDRTSRMLYSTDASNYQIEPVGVVIPRSTDDVLATVETRRLARRAAPAARRRLLAGRADGRRGPGDRLLQVPLPHPRPRTSRSARSPSSRASTSTCSTGNSDRPV